MPIVKQKRAVIVADSAAVETFRTLSPRSAWATSKGYLICPHCSAEQPSPETGADTWLPAEIQKHEGIRVCVACDESFSLHAVARVRFGAA